VQSQDTISATLGSQQLLSGLLAGLIGLVLVVGYSLLQYRTLGIVTIGSLVVSALLTYLVVDFLSWREGYRLSLAGVAGLIVSIGITADSFIVYFERIRDELREGKALVGAVEAGWRRAIRTVLASDGVNLLAAAVLYVLAIGDVRGFALTLGITTIIDVVVVSLFTHPLLQLIARRPFFAEGHRFSGLDPRALGAVYRGRGSFRAPAPAAALRSRGEAQRRQTIAERKAAQGGTAIGTIERPDGREDRD
jgi:preprotein translocase subunit SecD